MRTLDEIRKRAEAAAGPCTCRDGYDTCPRCEAAVASAQDVPALLAVVDALPRCAAGEILPLALCSPSPIAMKRTPTDGRLHCDRHAPLAAVDLPYAAALRALRAQP